VTRLRVGASAPTRFVVAITLVVLAATGCTTRGRSPVEAVTPATAASVPVTVAPRAIPTPATAAPPAAPTTATTAPLSPLAADLGRQFSALPEPVRTGAAPVSLTIEDIALRDAPVVAVGLEEDGQLEVPDETEVGWYELGARPGEPGATVLASHVSWNRKVGLFERLVRLEPGQQVSVGLADGTTRTYEVVERAQYGKEGLPADRIWTHEGPETLVLITCGGSFNPSIHRYADNIVVYAVPIA
jgi:hypothetical protein